jgi:serine phosphatase RsbU (regulator of sigma subunit)
MIVFIILASLSANFFVSEEYSFLSDTFFIVSVLLIIFNSLKISWIAFIVKKEKIYLLLLSIVITVLFVVNMNNSTGSNVHSIMLAKSFSPSLSRFTELMMMYGGIYFTILFFTTLFHIPTAEAFDRKAQEVSSLQYFSKLINQVLDFNDLAETVTDITIKVGSADSAWILWKANSDFKIIANKNIGYVAADLINSYIMQKADWIELQSVSCLQLEHTREYQKGEKILNAVAVAPLKSFEELKGVIIAGKYDDKGFSDEEVNAITTFSEYASVAIENSHLVEESIEKERLEKELDVAREIQKRILPDKNPVYESLDIASVFIPAFEVGGDYYDFFEIDEKKLGFVIADVSGKGISAAFIMAEVKGIFESLSKTIEKPKAILIKANQILRGALDSKTFVSAAYGLIDMDKNKLYLARAGHCPVLLLRKDIAEQIRPSGIGLGLSNTEYFEETLDDIDIDLEDNDTIVLYTDGITEAKNEVLEDFGENSFTQILLDNREQTADELSNKVIREVTLFSKNHSQYDDITLVIFKWKQKFNIVSLGEEPSLDGMEK